MNGACVGKGEGNSLNVAQLSAGIYTVRAVFADGSVVVVKIAK